MSYRAYPSNNLTGGYQPLPYYPALGVDAGFSAEGSLDVTVGNEAADAGIHHLESEGISTDSVKDAVKITAGAAAAAACAATGIGAVAAPLCGVVGAAVADWFMNDFVPAFESVFNPDKEAWEKYNRARAEEAANLATHDALIKAEQNAALVWRQTIEDLNVLYCRSSGGKKPGFIWLATALKNAGAMMETDPSVLCILDARTASMSATYKWSCGLPITDSMACRKPGATGTGPTPAPYTPASSGLCIPRFHDRWYYFQCELFDAAAKIRTPSCTKPSWCKSGTTLAQQTAFAQTVIQPMLGQFFERLAAAKAAVAIQITSQFAAQIAVRVAIEQKKKAGVTSTGKRPPPLKTQQKGWGWGIWALIGGGALGAYWLVRRPRAA